MGPDAATVLATPAFLKLDLFCRGLRVDSSSRGGGTDLRPRRTRAGLGSGVELILPDGLRVNAPIVESFSRDSPYVLRERPVAGHEITSELAPQAPPTPVDIAPTPRFYDATTSSGKTMSRIAVLQGTVLSVYVGRVCQYWTATPERSCRFCATGLNVGVAEEEDKTDDDVVEVARAARDECGITFVHLNAGYGGGGEATALIPLIRRIKRETRLLVGVQCPPQPSTAAYDKLREAGVDHVSFCVEFGNANVFRSLCPGKAETIGQSAYFDAIAYCARRFPAGAVSGELVAGPEPLADTLAAVDRITAAGAFPTVCVFRPLQGTPMEDEPVPSFEDMFHIFRHVYERLVSHRIPVGVAPGIDVSIIVTPAEARAFADAGGRSLSWRFYHAALWARKALAAAYLRTWGPR